MKTAFNIIHNNDILHEYWNKQNRTNNYEKSLILFE